MSGFAWVAHETGQAKDGRGLLHISPRCPAAADEGPVDLDTDRAYGTMPVLVNADRRADGREWCPWCRESLRRQKWASVVAGAEKVQQRQRKERDVARNLDIETRHYRRHLDGAPKSRRSCVFCRTPATFSRAAIEQAIDGRKAEVSVLKQHVEDREPELAREVAIAKRLEAVLQGS